jgi:ribosomal protein S11
VTARSAGARVEEAAVAVQRALTRRDAAIRAMREEGATLRAIGERARLTHAGVKKILERMPANGSG